MSNTKKPYQFWLSAMSFSMSTLQSANAQETHMNRTDAPLHLAAFGDSITRAFNANTPKDHPWNSWSTGNSDKSSVNPSGSVKSHAELLSEQTNQKVIVHNLAKTGATSGDLLRQVDSANEISIDYATMLIGANDLCAVAKPIGTGEQSDMSTFANRVETPIAKLIERNPGIKILLLAIPNLPRLQEIGHPTSCQRKWNTLNICSNLLKSNVTPDEISIFSAQWRIANEDLAAIAAKYSKNVIYSPAAAEYNFERKHLSDIDCFHPNILGQNILSSETWATGWWRP